MKLYLLTKQNEIFIVVGENKLGYEVIPFETVMTCIYNDKDGNEVIPPKDKEHLYSVKTKEVKPNILSIKKIILFNNVKVIDTNISVINNYKGK